VKFLVLKLQISHMTHVHVLIFMKIQVGAIVGLQQKKHAASEIMCW